MPLEVSYDNLEFHEVLIRGLIEIYAVHLAHRFPEGSLYGPEESKRWKEIKGKKINVRCRQYRATKPQAKHFLSSFNTQHTETPQ